MAMGMVGGVAWPIVAEMVAGAGVAWTNIPIAVRLTLAVPDHFRARTNSIVAFLMLATAPVGAGAAGLLVAGLGADLTMACLGGLLLLVVPFLLSIPGAHELFGRPEPEIDGYFVRAYPEAFGPVRSQ